MIFRLNSISNNLGCGFGLGVGYLFCIILAKGIEGFCNIFRKKIRKGESITIFFEEELELFFRCRFLVLKRILVLLM
jgi:hypothetical protein